MHFSCTETLRVGSRTRSSDLLVLMRLMVMRMMMKMMMLILMMMMMNRVKARKKGEELGLVSADHRRQKSS